MPTEQSPSRQTTAAQATDSGSRRDLPPRWSLPVTWVHNGALGAAVLTLFAPWLWTGALLLTWSPVLVLLVLVGWLLQPRQLMRGLWSVIALVLLAWPWLLTAWQARAPDVTDAARARPVVAVDGLAGADLPGPDQEGSDARLVAALLGVRLAVDDEAGERQLRGLPGIADWKEVLPRLQPAGGAVEPAYRYVILSRVRLDSWRTELLPDWVARSIGPPCTCLTDASSWSSLRCRPSTRRSVSVTSTAPWRCCANAWRRWMAH